MIYDTACLAPLQVVPIVQGLPMPLGRTLSLQNMDRRTMLEVVLVVVWAAFVLCGLCRQVLPLPNPANDTCVTRASSVRQQLYL